MYRLIRLSSWRLQTSFLPSPSLLHVAFPQPSNCSFSPSLPLAANASDSFHSIFTYLFLFTKKREKKTFNRSVCRLLCVSSHENVGSSYLFTLFSCYFFFRCNTSLYHIEYIATFSYPGFFFIFYLSSCILPLFLSLLFNVFFFNSSFIHLKLFCTIITSCLLNVIIIKIRSYQICLPITSRIFMFILFITLLTG